MFADDTLLYNSYSIGIVSAPVQQGLHQMSDWCSDLSWKSHVLSVAAKANRVLGLLKRTFGRRPEAIKMGYISMVRPMIEYACPAWQIN